MLNFENPNIEIVEISEDKKYGRFVVEPLERGYGITLGNSLRRIMLSSLPGAAVSQIKIEGVLHEFSAIPGVKEDVTEIVMNIKELAIRNNSSSDEPNDAHLPSFPQDVRTRWRWSKAPPSGALDNCWADLAARRPSNRPCTRWNRALPWSRTSASAPA